MTSTSLKQKGKEEIKTVSYFHDVFEFGNFTHQLPRDLKFQPNSLFQEAIKELEAKEKEIEKIRLNLNFNTQIGKEITIVAFEESDEISQLKEKIKELEEQLKRIGIEYNKMTPKEEIIYCTERIKKLINDG